MKLIGKDKVISLLSNKIADIKLDMKCGFLDKRKGTEKILMLKHIISLINTLEVTDVVAQYKGEVFYDGCGYFTDIEGENAALKKAFDENKLHNGDKVKVIIVKE